MRFTTFYYALPIQHMPRPDANHQAGVNTKYIHLTLLSQSRHDMHKSAGTLDLI